jgi:peptidoglycan-associated lipoprotein
MKRLILCVAVLNLLAACGSAPQKTESTTPERQTQAVPTSAVPATTATASEKSNSQVAASANKKNVATVRAQTDANISSETAKANTAETVARADAAQTRNETEAKRVPSNRSVYFPFDVDAVQAADMDTILAHGEYLSNHAESSVRVEGNADERGSSEYNLALGQRRANNAKKSLVLGGARSSQIEAVSYGEEKPKASGHDEAAWAQNRRVDIEYAGGK